MGVGCSDTPCFVFGGEHSGHFYFKDFFLADSGMIAALHVMSALAETDGTVSELMGQYERYVASGEINSTVDDAAAVMEKLSQKYVKLPQDLLDGLTVTGCDPIASGIENTNYFVRCEDGREFVLTLFEELNAAEAAFLPPLLQHLQREGVPVAGPLVAKGGKSLLTLRDKPVQLAPRIIGGHPVATGACC